MARTVAAALFVALALTSLPAAAAPAVFYNPATGGLWMKNDYDQVRLPFFGVGPKPSPALPELTTTDPSQFTVIPGAIFDSADLPAGFVYLHFPPTQGDRGIFIGNVIVPGTPASDFQGFYSISLGPDPRIDITVIPEPNAAIITITALVGLSALRQRPRRDR